MTRHISAALFSLILALVAATAAIAGSLAPPGAPAPTMRSIEQVKPTWDKIIPTAQRFVDALDGTAVLDKETGLVWEKSTSATKYTWADVQAVCTQAGIGGRRGWRLPTIEELASLLDPTQNNPVLPSGHLFTNVYAYHYWSSTTNAIDPNSAWDVHFGTGYVGYGSKYGVFYVRCVRGGQ